tara:strand:- start:485 stop:1021 length:537 start_codon:yes stop_codon:yes gene_type:complete
MSYFSKFPKLFYDIKANGELSVYTHILKRVKLHASAAANTKVFDYYQVGFGEKPEDIAFKYYGDATLHWVILLVNDVVDRFHQWPMTVPQFEAFVADKYSNPDGVHHYEIAQTSGDTTKTINIGTDNTGHSATATTVTNRAYEEAQQLLYSQIRLLKSDYLSQFVQEFEDLIDEGVET